MKNRPSAQSSSSEDSDEGPETVKPSSSKTPTTRNGGASSSESQSDSEGSLGHNLKQTSPKKAVSLSPLKQFTAGNPDLIRQESSVVIDEDDDISFLEVPKSLNVEELVGKSINFDKKTKVKINKVKYVIEPSDESIKPITLLTKKLQVIQPVARLQFREYTKHKNHKIQVETVKFKPSLPENLKVRHPLFGAEYKKKIVLSEDIEKKLDNTIDDFVKKMKKKKKHKERKSENQIIKEEPVESEETIFTLLESHSPGKKKKKKHKKVTTDTEEVEDEERDNRRKKINIINSTAISDFQLPSFEFDVSQIDEPTAKKIKNKNKKSSTIVHNNTTSDQEELEEAQNYNESSTVNKRKREETDVDEYEREESPTKKKKTPNKVSIKEETRFDLQLPSFEFDPGMRSDMEVTSKTKKKKKEKSYDESEFETDKESSPKKRKFTLSENDTSDRRPIKKENKSDSEESSPKKKRKKIKQETEATSLITNLLTMVKDEIDVDDTRKKRKSKSAR